MTALAYLPNMPRRCARLVENAKRENAAEERAANLITARAVLNNPALHRTDDIRNSIILLESRGDMRGDLILADEATHDLAIRERREAHAAARWNVMRGKRVAAVFAGLLIAYAVGLALYAIGWVQP